MENHEMNNSASSQENKKEYSLEEMDILCRKYHHLHDEEILRILGRFFKKIADLFTSNKRPRQHSSTMIKQH